MPTSTVPSKTPLQSGRSTGQLFQILRRLSEKVHKQHLMAAAALCRSLVQRLKKDKAEAKQLRHRCARSNTLAEFCKSEGGRQGRTVAAKKENQRKKTSEPVRGQDVK